MPVSMMLTIMVVLLIDRAFYKPLRASPVIILVIASFGLMLMMRSVIQFSWGVQLKTILPGIQPRLQLLISSVCRSSMFSSSVVRCC